VRLIPFFGDTPVSAITSEKIEDFIASRRKAGGASRWVDRGLSESSVRSGLIPLRLILERAVKARHLPANPALRVGRFPVREEETVDPFTVADLRAILCRRTGARHDLCNHAAGVGPDRDASG
jgi:hypothetical protein